MMDYLRMWRFPKMDIFDVLPGGGIDPDPGREGALIDHLHMWQFFKWTSSGYRPARELTRAGRNDG
jgi:hypothetical protein